MGNKQYNERVRFFRKKPDKSEGVVLSVTYLPNELCDPVKYPKPPKVLFEVAKLIPGTDNYDWDSESKILMNFGKSEIAKFVALAKKSVKKLSFFHTPHSGSRVKNFVALNCEWREEIDGWKLHLNFDRNKDTKYFISLDTFEVESLRMSFEEAFRLILNWTNDLLT